MPYWIARLLGRADGDAVARCVMCETHFPRKDGIRPTGTTGLVCSDVCAEEAARTFAW